MRPLAEFDAAIQRVTRDRGAVYGHPADDFGRVAKMAEQIAACPDAQMRHVLYMILVKVSRLVVTPGHMDSLIDIAGYARTGAMLLDRKQP